MLQNIRSRLRTIPALHNSYMRLKRLFNSELVGMTTKTEQQYLANYGEKLYRGNGAIVDLGCWLGSTTLPLLGGLLKNPAFVGSGKKIYAYDLFLWFDWMNESVAGTDLWGKYAEGDNFVDEFKKRIDPYVSSVEVREGDLRTIGWADGQIEFLLVDAMKGWDLANAIVRDFYPSLIPSKGLVFHQDFGHYFTPWIHLIQWQFRDYFEFVDEVPSSQSVVFKCIKEIPAGFSAADRSFDAFDKDDVEKAFEYSMGLVSADKLSNVAAAKVMWFVHQNKRVEAKRVLNDLVSSNIPIQQDLQIVTQLIAEK